MFPLTCALLASFLSQASVAQGSLPIPDVENGRWELAYSQVEKEGAIFEFLPKGETLEDWNEMVTVQYFSYELIAGKISPLEFMMKVRSDTTELFPSVQWNVIAAKDSEVVYEWSLAGSPLADDQHEIARLADETLGISRLAYVKKTGRLPHEERAKWLHWMCD